jgi:hypothetical protein
VRTEPAPCHDHVLKAHERARVSPVPHAINGKKPPIADNLSNGQGAEVARCFQPGGLALGLLPWTKDMFAGSHPLPARPNAMSDNDRIFFSVTFAP